MRKRLSWSVYVMAACLAAGCVADRSKTPTGGDDAGGTITAPGRVERTSRDAGAAAASLGVAVAPLSPQMSLILTLAGAGLGAMADHLAKRRRIRQLLEPRQQWTAAERRHFQNTGEAPAGKPPRPSTAPASPPPVLPDAQPTAQTPAQLQAAA